MASYKPPPARFRRSQPEVCDMDVDSPPRSPSPALSVSTPVLGRSMDSFHSLPMHELLVSPPTAVTLIKFSELTSSNSPRGIACSSGESSESSENSDGVSMPGFDLSSSPQEYAPRLMEMLRVNASVAAGAVAPSRVKNGTGGTYILKNGVREPIGVFKPADEEPFCEYNPNGFTENREGDRCRKRGVPAGDSAWREIAAYLLDHKGEACVPPTAAISLSHPAFEYRGRQLRPKNGSFQQWVPHVAESWDFGPSRFAVREVHSIGLLDVRVLNCDRHGGNILVRSNGSLVPIDHGYILPSTLDEAWFEWLIWPQAKMPFSSAAVEYVNSLSIEDDVKLLESCVWEGRQISRACLRVFRACNIVLRESVNAGLNLYEIGLIVCRMDPNVPCWLERLAIAALRKCSGRDAVFDPTPAEHGQALEDRMFAAVRDEEEYFAHLQRLATEHAQRVRERRGSST